MACDLCQVVKEVGVCKLQTVAVELSRIGARQEQQIIIIYNNK